MIIGIDASRAFIEKRTGIEEYSYQVIKNLMDKIGKEHQVILYVKKPQCFCSVSDTTVVFETLQIPANWKIKKISWPRLWTQIGLSLEMLFNKVDTLFIPAHTVPFIHPKNTIVTIHGLEYEFCPQAYSFWERLYMRWSIKNSCKWAKKIIAVSENTKKDLIKLYKVPTEKVEVIYEGYDLNSEFRISNFESSSNDRITKPYLLFIGRLEERKNILGIIKAFEILKEKYKIPHRLILAGKPGFNYKEILSYLSQSSHKSDIVLSGFVNESEKYRLLKNADLFLFPSFYEGFGLPILEAQSVETSIVASIEASIPEVAGGGALLVNPKKPEEIADAVQKILSDENLKKDLIQKGLENVKRFSWDKCAEEIDKILTA